jgi:uncharacterized protein YndB with AHSA1/START domain
MPYTFTLTAAIPASPQEIYEAWLDSLGHSEMTGGEASMSDQVGVEVTAWDGYISGCNLQLIPGERIVQSWRTEEFGDEHEDSIVTIVLTEAGDGTLLTLEHSKVPDDQRSYEDGGWHSNYFEPMVAYFTVRKRATSASSEQAARQTMPRAARKSAGKRPANSARKAKPAPRAKSKGASPRAKAASRKSKVKKPGKARRGAAAAARRDRAKPIARKSRRNKRR